MNLLLSDCSSDKCPRLYKFEILVQPHGISPADNVVKECGEEASIPEDIARTAVPVGAVSYEALQDRWTY